MWPFKTKTTTPGDVTVEVEHVKTTRKAVMSVLVQNNITGETRSYKSENTFGLDWKVSDGNRVSLKQFSSITEDAWFVIAVLIGYSIVEVGWETITEPEEITTTTVEITG